MKGFRMRIGFTLVEVMVATVVFALAAGGMYAFLRHGNLQSTRAYTRQAMVTQANIVLKAMQDDFRMAASASLKFDESKGEVSLQQHRGGDKLAQITYKWEKPRLLRKVVFDKSTSLRVLSTAMDAFSVETKPRPSISETDYADTPEQVAIRLKLKAEIPGLPEALEHEQHAMATMREVSSVKNDPHWRDVGDMKGAFNTYGNLLNSIGEDSKLLVEDISKTLKSDLDRLEENVEEALNKPKANLEETKRQLRNALTEIAQADLDLNSAIKDCEQNMKDLPDDILERKVGKIGTWTANKGKTIDRIQRTFSEMKTVEQMDYNKLKKAAGSFELKDTFKSIFDSKKDALVQRNKLAGDKSTVEGLLAKVNAANPATGSGLGE
ncbi:MAG TPA: prepilin-type N-terminal cleavage/methylation domain-containing protein [Candidatus Ozemobacteraceae bacterium]|nr:prepilin-type N-terminal cleavage/methylation domain-containing protein [Candidatus Ozemobacteraceae bacterium]